MSTNMIIATLLVVLAGIVVRDRLRRAAGQVLPADLGLTATSSPRPRAILENMVESDPTVPGSLAWLMADSDPTNVGLTAWQVADADPTNVGSTAWLMANADPTNMGSSAWLEAQALHDHSHGHDDGCTTIMTTSSITMTTIGERVPLPNYAGDRTPDRNMANHLANEQV